MPDFYTVPATGLQDALKRGTVTLRLLSTGEYIALVRDHKGDLIELRAANVPELLRCIS